MSRSTVAVAPTLPIWPDAIRRLFRGEWLAKLFGPDCEEEDTRSSAAPWLADEATLEILHDVVSVSAGRREPADGESLRRLGTVSRGS